MAYIVKIDDREFKLEVLREGSHFRLLVDGREMHAEIASPYENNHIALIIDNKLYNIIFNAENRVSVNEEEYTAEIYDEQVHKLIKASPEMVRKQEVVITVPMPGLVVDVEVKEGESVKAGQGLAVVEAMKMQNEIKSPLDGVVKKIYIKKGQTVNSREKLIIIE